MRRRSFLMTGLAGALSGCATAPIAQLPEDEVVSTWPALGRFVDVDGYRIHAWDQGSGQPVVLLHGASGNLRDWTFKIAPALAANYRVIAFDRPGLGYSQRPKIGGGDVAVQARMLRSAAAKLGIQKPILVGHSLGAALAMAWALQDPESVSGIVTVSGAVMPWSEKPMLAEMIGLDQLLIGVYFNYLEATAARGGIERFVSRIFRPQVPPEGYLDYVGGPLSLRAETLASNKQDVAALNTALRRQAPDYGSLTMPVEIISGTADFIIEPNRQPLPFADRLARSNVTLLDGVGHMAHHVAPDPLYAAVARLAATA